MKHIASVDFGSSEVKFTCVNGDGEVIFFSSQNIQTIKKDGFLVQDPNDWYNAFCNLSGQLFEKIDPSEVGSLIFSGQMQDLILMDENANAIGDAILYHDQRGGECLLKISEEKKHKIESAICNHLDGSIPLTKLMWLNEYMPDKLAKTHKIGISAKDFIIAKLTGEFVSDVTSLSTGGIYDMAKCDFIKELESLGISKNIMPKIKYPNEICGEISAVAQIETGYQKGAKVYAGIGDAGGATLASGIANAGEININIGTSGWVASVSEKTIENAFNLQFTSQNLYINVVPLLNAGGVHSWIAKTIGESGKEYQSVHELVKSAKAGASGLLFLPYITGERFPVADGNVRGCYIGISSETTKSDIAKATLEGVAYSVKQGLLSLGINPTKISIIGGGAKETEWNQIFADVLESDVEVFENSQHLSCVAVASIVSNAKNKNAKVTTYKQNLSNQESYRAGYARFVKIYPSVKDLF